MTRPTFCTNDHLEFLDTLRDRGEVNMFGSLPYLEAEFNLVRPVAREILEYWMKTYGKEDR